MENQIEQMVCKNCIHYHLCVHLFRKAKVKFPNLLFEEESFFASADDCGFYEDKRIYRKQSEGEWKKSAHGKYDYFCSACGVKAMSRCYGNHDDLSKFCPNCGAKMNGE